MQLVQADEIQWRQISQHRAESPWFRRLLQGDRGGLNNFEFTEVKVDGAYETPRHRHNFDQVRIMLEGEFNYGRATQKEGMIGYFPAGTFYRQNAKTSSVTLLLQVGSACLQPYLDYDQVEEAAARLAQKGTFSDGLYRWAGEDGGDHVRDGYEAVFIEAAGEEPTYPKPRFLDPVIMDPEGVTPISDKDLGGTTRDLGVFNEYGIGFSIREGNTGERITLKGAGGQSALVYCRSGEAEMTDGQEMREGTAVRLSEGESVELGILSAICLLQINLPAFDDAD